MRTTIFVGLALLAAPVLASDSLLSRQDDTCAELTQDCPIAQDFCYDYLKIGPARETSRTTIATVTERKTSTVWESTSACSVSGPKGSQAANVQARSAAGRLEERAKTPACLKPYTTAASALSSACSCYDYPITSSTTTIRVTKTSPGAPTTTEYRRTVTHTTLTASPTCQVLSTDGETGEVIAWKNFYRICNGFRSGGLTPGYYDASFSRKTPLCEALQRCANGTLNGGGRTFELSWVNFGTALPKWDCSGYGASPNDPPLDFYDTNTWHETYGYVHEPLS